MGPLGPEPSSQPCGAPLSSSDTTSTQHGFLSSLPFCLPQTTGQSQPGQSQPGLPTTQASLLLRASCFCYCHGLHTALTQEVPSCSLVCRARSGAGVWARLLSPLTLCCLLTSSAKTEWSTRKGSEHKPRSLRPHKQRPCGIVKRKGLVWQELVYNIFANLKLLRTMASHLGGLGGRHLPLPPWVRGLNSLNCPFPYRVSSFGLLYF